MPTGNGRFTAWTAVDGAAAVMRHPGYLIALTVLVVNDRWLKGLAPGLVTGKLSDVAWLLVAAPLAGLLLAPVAPWVGYRRWAAAAAAVPALVLVALKAGRASADVVEGAVSWLWPTATTVDWTDLLVAPVALVAWRLLLRVGPRGRRSALLQRPPRGRPARERPVPAAGGASARQVATWLLLGLAVTATTATSCVNTRGVVAVEAVEGGLRAEVEGSTAPTWESPDDGHTWTARDEASSSVEDPSPEAACLDDGRCFTAGVLDLRLDGEVMWSLPASRAGVLQRGWDRQQGCGASGLDVGVPLVLGNGQVVVPRGVDGALVGSTSDGFQRVGLAGFQPAPLRSTSPSLLGEEFLPATIAGVLGVLLTAGYGFTSRAVDRPTRLRGGIATTIALVLLVTVPAGLVLLATLIVVEPVVALGLIVLYWLAVIPGAVIGGVRGQVLMAPLASGLGTAAAILLPFLGWLAGLVRYDVANALAVVLGVAVAASGPLQVRRWKAAHPPAIPAALTPRPEGEQPGSWPPAPR